MNWLLVALVAVVVLGAPPHPDNFAMRIVPENPENANGAFSRRERAACISAQIKKKQPASACEGSVTM